MKERKIGLVFIYLLIVTLLLTACSSKSGSNINDSCSTALERIEKQQSFNFIVSKEKAKMPSFIKKYYKNVYEIKYDFVTLNKDNKSCVKLLNKIDKNININSVSYLVTLIDHGQVVSYFNSSMTENSFKNYIIDNNILDKKYKEIDYVFKDDEFKEYSQNNKIYWLLYLDSNDKKMYEYRKVLVKRNIQSLIMYSNEIDQVHTSSYFNKQLGIEDMGENNGLPVLMKIKNGEILSRYNNITLKDFEDKLE